MGEALPTETLEPTISIERIETPKDDLERFLADGEIDNWIKRPEFASLSYDEKIDDLTTLFKTKRWDDHFQIEAFETEAIPAGPKRKQAYENWDLEQVKKLVDQIQPEAVREELITLKKDPPTDPFFIKNKAPLRRVRGEKLLEVAWPNRIC